jgi:hypothetical protein
MLASSAFSQSTQLGYATTQGTPIRCVVKNRGAFVLTGYGLEIYLVSTPSSPVTLGKLQLPAGDKYDLAASDASYVYVPSASFGVYIIDVSNGNAPSHVGTIPLSSLGFDADFVEIADGKLYVLSSTEGFRVFDIGTNPTAPSLLGTYNPPTATHYLQDGEVVGSTMFACDAFNGLAAFDLSNLSSITKIADSGLTNAWDVAVLGDVAVDVSVPTGTGPVRFWDVSFPLSDPLPSLDTEFVSSSGFSWEVDAAEESNGSRYAYSSHVGAGVKVWLMDDPTNVQLDETVTNTLGAQGVTYHRGLLFVCISYSGTKELRIFQR